MGGQTRAVSAARRLAVGYAVVAVVWIVASDWAFDRLAPQAGFVENAVKGMGFVLVTACVLYRLTLGMYRREAELLGELGLRDRLQAAMFNRSPEAMWVYDPESLELLEVNDTMVERSGRRRDELLGLRTVDLGPIQDADRVIHRLAGADRVNEPHLWLHYGPGGEPRWVEVVSHLVEWQGRTARLALSRDITAQKRAEDELRSSERRLTSVLTAMQEMAYSIDVATGAIAYLNQVAGEVLGRPIEELPRTLDDFVSIVVPGDRAHFLELSRAVVVEGWIDDSFRIRLPDESERRLQVRARGVIDQSGRVQAVEGVIVDASSREELVDLVERQRSFDLLTGLPNRASFVAAVEERLDGGGESPPAAVALFDLDRFAAINQSAGHHAGDAVLVAVAARITATLEPGMLAARVGGDEFAVFVPAGTMQAEEVGERLRRAVDDVFDVAGYEFFVSLSVGVATATEPEDSAEGLLRDADLAMSQAKERTAGVEFFHPVYRSQVAEHVRLERDLRRALADGEILAVYQPEVSLETDRIVAVETLARWQHPERGTVPASEFIGVAEDSNLIVELGQAMLTQACTTAARWRRAYGIHAPVVWVNLSRRELDDPSVVSRVLETIGSHGLSSQSIGIEVTETAFVVDGGPGIRALRALADAGLAIALDDFGTGWSSLQSLKSFPLSVVKIDRSFVTNVGASIDDTQITRAIIGMATGMSLQTLAEGVENADQLDQLRAMGCDQVQGYYLGRPMPAGEIEALLDDGGIPVALRG
ncbi:MAG: putative bifunctional diguanylate cyclase/phosphodiesterase [Acidimicrobiales bacterium]